VSSTYWDCNRIADCTIDDITCVSSQTAAARIRRLVAVSSVES
jgi:hypothetical protein